jgi:hypothetical protein
MINERNINLSKDHYSKNSSYGTEVAYMLRITLKNIWCLAKMAFKGTPEV